MARNQSQLERPLGKRPYFRVPAINQEMVGRVSERFARAMGTGAFLIGITVVVLVWITWNTLAPQNMQIDLQILRNAAAGCSASQRGLNIPEIKQVLSHFNAATFA